MNAMSLLIKPTSSSCNMRCRYCFYADVADHRTVRNYGLMSEGTLETLVRKALAETESYCVFGFQGGEPTLAGLDFFRRLVELVDAHNRNHIRVSYTLQTNGQVIDEEWVAFLAKHKFLVGLSIDGPKAVHDELRKDAGGRETHRQCLQAARLLKAAGVEFNILTVVTRPLAAHPDRTYKFYRQQGFAHLQLIPCIEGFGDESTDFYSLTAMQYGAFLSRVFDLWYEDFRRGEYIAVRAFDNYIHILMGHPPENCSMNGICHAYALVEADGSVYPCDFYAMDEYRLGHIGTHSLEEMLTGEEAKRFIAPSLHVHGHCRDCAYAFLCRQGCRRDREPLVDGKPQLNRFCEAYKAFFAHALPRMLEIARAMQNGYGPGQDRN